MCMCVYICCFVFCDACYAQQPWTSQKGAAGQESDGSAGRAGGFPQENCSTCCKGINALARQQKLKKGLAHGRVLQGLGWCFPSIHLTPLLSCYQGWGPRSKWIHVPYGNGKYQCLTPHYSSLILLWIHLAFQGCIPGSLCNN